MYGFLLRPKWIAFHLLVFCSVALMIALGFWQLDRLEQRQAFNDVVEARIDEPPVPLSELPAVSNPAELEWRQVTVSGTFEQQQIVWFNRSQEGIAGDNVLTVLADQRANGQQRAIVINRGFVPLGADTPPPPSGSVEILGRIRLPAERRLGQLTDSTEGPVTEVRRIDLEQLDAQIEGKLEPFYLDLIGSVPNVTGADPVPVPPPTLDEGPHLSYAVQWFIFAGAVLLGWVLAIRRSVASRRGNGALSDERVARAGPDCPTSVDAEVTTTTT